MSNRKKTLILFDVGAVQVSIDFDLFYKRLSELSQDFDSKELRRIYGESDLDIRFAEGLPIKDYLTLLRKLIHIRDDVSDEGLENAYLSKLDSQIESVIEIKERLSKSGYSTGIFSNIDPLVFNFISTTYPRVFETSKNGSSIAVSFRVGSVKPKKVIYETINGFERVIYIDDNKVYVQVGTNQFGWNGIWFTPFIDPGETQRQKEGGSELNISSNRFSTASSIDELVKSLEAFNLEL